ncbi:hypothetical protein PI126_g20178 [Phytophthora idaei]|nr:hypothetical protein PI126_g20178 [Phytophthora idaei]
MAVIIASNARRAVNGKNKLSNGHSLKKLHGCKTGHNYWVVMDSKQRRVRFNKPSLRITKATRKVIRAWLVPQQASNKETSTGLRNDIDAASQANKKRPCRILQKKPPAKLAKKLK